MYARIKTVKENIVCVGDGLATCHFRMLTATPLGIFKDNMSAWKSEKIFTKLGDTVVKLFI